MSPAGDTTERQVQQLARSLYREAARHRPSIFEPRDWLGKMIEWSLENESLRVALFRFVDVLPSLDSAADIGRHLEEYFAKVDHAFGGLVFLAQALHAGWLLAPVARQNVTRLAHRFIVDEEPDALSAALEKITSYIDLGKREGKCALERDAPGEGFFVGPAIFSGIEPSHRLANKEIFGPALSVIKARGFDYALAIANRSSFALTGGLKLSGIGSKASGPDYLLQFLEPRTISENTLRHGFVPPEELTE